MKNTQLFFRPQESFLEKRMIFGLDSPDYEPTPAPSERQGVTPPPSAEAQVTPSPMKERLNELRKNLPTQPSGAPTEPVRPAPTAAPTEPVRPTETEPVKPTPSENPTQPTRPE